MKKVIMILTLVVSTYLSAAKINGFIMNKSNGERIPYASVFIRSVEKGTQSNEQGYFLIKKLYPGNYILRVQQIGYETKKIEIDLKDINESQFLNIELKMKAVEIIGTEVKGEMDIFNQSIDSPIIEVSKMRQTMEEIKEISYIAEADVFRAVQTLPGVTPISDFSSGLYIRGGSADQNLLLLDEVDVYNPNHFGGLFSTFNTDAIQSVELYKGGFPAKYGGRLSAVLDLKNLDGNRKEVEGISRISLIAGSTTIQSPWHFGSQSGSVMGSFRRTYFDLITQQYDLPDYYFYDGHFKFNWDLPNNDKLITSFYFGQDHLELSMGFDLG
ncbi:MAG: TonB-dependent receptor, partial [Candidatus Cloacimonadota bacterium]|nr:TonB-dependent receptor [Candidatus Cloacimonadota bacterium]